MLEVRFDVLGEEQYARRFQSFGERITHLKPAFERVAEVLHDTVSSQFDDEGAHGLGSRWQQLNEDYEAWKRAKVGDKPILQLTGAMRRAFLEDGTRDLTDTHLVWGIDTQTDEDGQPIKTYADAHQAGKGRMPQRKIVALRTDDRRQIDRAFVEHINYLRNSVFGR